MCSRFSDQGPRQDIRDRYAGLRGPQEQGEHGRQRPAGEDQRVQELAPEVRGGTDWEGKEEILSLNQSFEGLRCTQVNIHLSLKTFYI